MSPVGWEADSTLFNIKPYKVIRTIICNSLGNIISPTKVNF